MEKVNNTWKWVGNDFTQNCKTADNTDICTSCSSGFLEKNKNCVNPLYSS